MRRWVLLFCLLAACTPVPARVPSRAARSGGSPAPSARAPDANTPAAPAPEVSPAPSEPYASESEEGPDDGAESGEDEPLAPEPAATAPRPHPLDGWSDADIERAFRDNPELLGSMSVGRPGAGALVNGVQMPRGDGWVLLDPGNCWGTEETVENLERSIGRVRERFADAHPLFIGHISAKKGGALRPHISHQAGRDVDISYYVTDGSARRYGIVGEANLDREKTWAFVRALVTDTDVELILIDRSIQKLLIEYALSVGEDPGWVSSLFNGVPGKQRPLVFHAKGHKNHLHVRFYSPVAQETARRAYPALVRHGFAHAATSFVEHRAKKGETLGMLARKYGTSVREIQLANGMHGTRLKVKQVYRVPRRGKVDAPGRVVVPPRRLPPDAPASARAE